MSNVSFSTTPQERYLEDYVEGAIHESDLLRSRRTRLSSLVKSLIRSFSTQTLKGPGKRFTAVSSPAAMTMNWTNCER